MIDENRRFARPGVSEARRLLLEILSVRLAGIVTTNYDLLLEYALGTQEFNYGRVGERLAGRGRYPVSQWRNPVVLRGRVPVAKVHGSISWDRSSRYTDGRRGLTGDALIIAPVPGKEVPPHLRDQWNLAARILERSTRLIVFGFAFNPYDELFLEHLQHHGRHLREVLLGDPKPNFPAAQRLWPSARVLALPPRPEKENELRAWVRLEEIAVEELHEHLTSGWSTLIVRRSAPGR